MTSTNDDRSRLPESYVRLFLLVRSSSFDRSPCSLLFLVARACEISVCFPRCSVVCSAAKTISTLNCFEDEDPEDYQQAAAAVNIRFCCLSQVY